MLMLMLVPSTHLSIHVELGKGCQRGRCRGGCGRGQRGQCGESYWCGRRDWHGSRAGDGGYGGLDGVDAGQRTEAGEELRQRD